MRRLLLLLILCRASISFAQQNPEIGNIGSSETYRDALGNIITKDAFEERLKSGLYEKMVKLEMDRSSKNHKISYFLKLKSEFEKEFALMAQDYIKRYLNSPFPDFRLKKLDGTEISLTSMQGKTIVLNFWFIGCQPCVAEMPLLNNVVNHYKDQPDVVFLAPAPDEKEKLISFLDKRIFIYQVLSSSDDLIKKLQINSFPTHMVVDSNGVMREILVGDKDDIDKFIIKAIDKIASK